MQIPTDLKPALKSLGFTNEVLVRFVESYAMPLTTEEDIVNWAIRNPFVFTLKDVSPKPARLAELVVIRRSAMLAARESEKAEIHRLRLARAARLETESKARAEAREARARAKAPEQAARAARETRRKEADISRVMLGLTMERDDAIRLLNAGFPVTSGRSMRLAYHNEWRHTVKDALTTSEREMEGDAYIAQLNRDAAAQEAALAAAKELGLA